jgi:hypothetical protein
VLDPDLTPDEAAEAVMPHHQEQAGVGSQRARQDGGDP